MSDITIEVQPRNITGKAVKQLRNEGLVPAVIHDHGKESVLVEGPYIEFEKMYRQAGKHHTVSVKAGKKQYMALIKTVEYDPKKHQIQHIVFNAVNANQKVDAEIPVHPKLAEGNEQTPAERAGLVVLRQLESVEIEALPQDLPDAIEYDAEQLIAIGDQITVADLIVPQGVTIKTEPTHPIVTVFEPSALQAANEEAGGDAEEETLPEEGEGTEEGATEEGASEEGKSESGDEPKSE